MLPRSQPPSKESLFPPRKPYTLTVGILYV